MDTYLCTGDTHWVDKIETDYDSELIVWVPLFKGFIELVCHSNDDMFHFNSVRFWNLAVTMMKGGTKTCFNKVFINLVRKFNCDTGYPGFTTEELVQICNREKCMEVWEVLQRRREASARSVHCKKGRKKRQFDSASLMNSVKMMICDEQSFTALASALYKKFGWIPYVVLHDAYKGLACCLVNNI